jgi:hypothetical protein
MLHAPPPSRTPPASPLREHLPTVVCATVLVALSFAGYAIGARTGAELEAIAFGLPELHATTAAPRHVLSHVAFARLVLMQNGTRA